MVLKGRKTDVGRSKIEESDNLKLVSFNEKHLNKVILVNYSLLLQINEVVTGTSDFRLLTSDKTIIPTKLTIEPLII